MDSLQGDRIRDVLTHCYEDINLILDEEDEKLQKGNEGKEE